MEKESASIHVQARLTPSEYAPFKKLIEITGAKKATLFRHVILSNKNNVVHLGQSSEEEEAKKRMVFIANKASNNLNQIAKRLNQAYRGEVIREQHYTRIMNELIGLRSTFKKGIDQC